MVDPAADPVAARRSEQERLLALAREYIERLSVRLPVKAAAVVGSVARGDFNVWSDVDVVVVSDALPWKTPERAAILTADAPGGVQAVGFTSEEFRAALARGNRLASAVSEEGVVVIGESFFRANARPGGPR